MPFQIPYLFNPLFYKSHKCNKLEKLINKERKKKGLKALKCDYGLYYVAWWHTKDQNDYYQDGGRYNGSCNAHSWMNDYGKNWGDYTPCCFDLRQVPTKYLIPNILAAALISFFPLTNYILGVFF